MIDRNDGKTIREYRTMNKIAFFTIAVAWLFTFGTISESNARGIGTRTRTPSVNTRSFSNPQWSEVRWSTPNWGNPNVHAQMERRQRPKTAAPTIIQPQLVGGPAAQGHNPVDTRNTSIFRGGYYPGVFNDSHTPNATTNRHAGGGSQTAAADGSHRSAGGLPSDFGHAAANTNNIGWLAYNPDRFHQQAVAEMHRRGEAVRRNFQQPDDYTADWHAQHPESWFTTNWAHGNAWTAATWDNMNSWLSYDNVTPIYYGYGDNVYRQDNDVFIDGAKVCSVDQFFDQAQNLANAGSKEPAADTEWLPLGVFALSHPDETKPTQFLQLAIDSHGTIKGNYSNQSIISNTKTIEGTLDKTTQRAAWRVGGKSGIVIETGVFNLTKDQAPCLVHFEKERTELWLLVRMKHDQASTSVQTLYHK